MRDYSIPYTPSKEMPVQRKWADIPQAEREQLVGIRKTGIVSGAPERTDYAKEQIEKLRTATLYTWKSGHMPCYLCGENVQHVPCRFVGMPFIAHASCVDEAPIHKPTVRVAIMPDGSTRAVDAKNKPLNNADGTPKVARPQNVERWVRDFHAQHDTSKEFTVHNVLAWITANAGPTFSYAGVRRMCKLLFTVTGVGSFKANEVLVENVAKATQAKKKRTNVSMKQYTATGRRKYGVKKKGKK